MGKIPTPSVLKMLFGESNRAEIIEFYESLVPYNKETQDFYRSLFDNYFSPYKVKQTLDFFEDLADKLNDYAKEDNLFRSSTLRNIYFPDGKRKRKKILIFLYNFIEKELAIRQARSEKNRVVDGDNSPNESKLEIIRYEVLNDDFNEIFRTYKGLFFALCYWARVYDLFETQLSWRALLVVADFYNENNFVSCDLLEIANDTHIHQILFKFLDIKSIQLFAYKQAHTVTFKNSLIVQGVLKIPLKEYGSGRLTVEAIVFDFFKVLSEKSMFNSAEILGSKLALYLTERRFNNIGKINYTTLLEQFFEREERYYDISEINAIDEEVALWYVNFNTVKEIFWKDKLTILVYLTGIDDDLLSTILKRLLKLGCKSKVIYDTERYINEGNDKAKLHLNSDVELTKTRKSVKELILSRGWELPAQKKFIEFDEINI